MLATPAGAMTAMLAQEYDGDYALGDVVTVTLPAGVAKEQLRYSIPQITGIGVEHVVKKSSGYDVKPIKLTSVAEIANYYSMPVTIEVTTAETGVWMTGNANSTIDLTAGGVKMAAYFNKTGYETFTNVSYVATTAEITGIASVYNGTQQVCPRNLDDVAAFAPVSPTITTLSPGTLAWDATETAAKTITVSGAKLDGVTLTPALSGDGADHFTTSVSGTTITVTPKAANETTADIIATLTISADGGNSMTATLTHAKPATGGGTPTVVSVDFTVQPDNFPLKGADGAKQQQTFTISGYDFTFIPDTSNQYYFVTGSSTYVLFGKKGAAIEFPVVDGKKLTKVVCKSRKGASTNVMIGVADSSNAFIGGGAAIQWNDTTTYEYTYNLTGTIATAKYRLLINSAHNAQLVALELTYE